MATMAKRPFKRASHTDADIRVIWGECNEHYDQTGYRPKREIEERQINCRIFESAAQFVAEATASYKASNEFTNDCFDDSDFVGRWFGDWDDVVAACNEPWAEGIKILERLSSKLDAHLPEPVDRRRRQRWDEYDGDDICLDRLRGGTPYWRQTRRETTTAPQNVTLCVDISTMGQVAAEDIFWRGATALVVTKHLEAAGYRVELWAVNSTSISDARLFQAFRLKSAEDGLNLGLLAADLSGWFYRSVVFQSRHSTGLTTGGSFVGGSKYVEPCMLELIHPGEMPHLIEHVWDEKKASKTIAEMLAAFGAKIGGAA